MRVKPSAKKTSDYFSPPKCIYVFLADCIFDTTHLNSDQLPSKDLDCWWLHTGQDRCTDGVEGLPADQSSAQDPREMHESPGASLSQGQALQGQEGSREGVRRAVQREEGKGGKEEELCWPWDEAYPGKPSPKSSRAAQANSVGKRAAGAGQSPHPWPHPAGDRLE